MFRIQDNDGQLFQVKSDKNDINLLWVAHEGKGNNLISVRRDKLQNDVRKGMYTVIKKV